LDNSQISNTLNPEITNVSNIGTTGNQFNNVYSKNFYQNGIKVISTATAPINVSNGNVSIDLGTEFQVNSSGSLIIDPTSITDTISSYPPIVYNPADQSISLNYDTTYINIIQDSLSIDLTNITSNNAVITNSSVQNLTATNVSSANIRFGNISNPLYYNGNDLSVRYDNTTIKLNGNNALSVKASDFILGDDPITVKSIDEYLNLSGFSLSQAAAYFGISEAAISNMTFVSLDYSDKHFGESSTSVNSRLKLQRTTNKDNQALFFDNDYLTSMSSFAAHYGSNSVSIGNLYIEDIKKCSTAIFSNITTGSLHISDNLNVNTIKAESSTIGTLSVVEAVIAYSEGDGIYYTNSTINNLKGVEFDVDYIEGNNIYYTNSTLSNLKGVEFDVDYIEGNNIYYTYGTIANMTATYLSMFNPFSAISVGNLTVALDLKTTNATVSNLHSTNTSLGNTFMFNGVCSNMSIGNDLNVVGNSTFTYLEADESFITNNTLNNILSTNSTITNLNVSNSTISSLQATTATIGSLSSNSATIGTLRSSNIHAVSNLTVGSVFVNQSMTIGSNLYITGNITYVDSIKAGNIWLTNAITASNLLITSNISAGAIKLTGNLSCNEVSVNDTQPNNSNSLTSKAYVDNTATITAGNGLEKTNNSLKIKLEPVVSGLTVGALGLKISNFAKYEGYGTAIGTLEAANVLRNTIPVPNFLATGASQLDLFLYAQVNVLNVAVISLSVALGTTNDAINKRLDPLVNLTTGFKNGSLYCNAFGFLTITSCNLLNIDNQYIVSQSNSTGNLNVSGSAYIQNLNVLASSIGNLTLTNTTISNAHISNLRFTNATVSNLFSTNLSSTNLVSTNLSSTNLVCVALSSGNSIFTNASTTNFSFTNATGNNLITTNLVSTNSTSTNLVCSAISSGNSIFTNALTTNLSFTDATGNNLITTNLVSTNSSSTNLVCSALSSGNSILTNCSTNSLQSNFSQIGTLSVANLTSPVSILNTITCSNLLVANSVITNASMNNLSIPNITSPNATFTNLTVQNLLVINNATNVSSSNIIATFGTINNLLCSNITTSSLRATSAIITNFNTPTLNATNGLITNISNTAITTTSLIATNISTSSLAFTSLILGNKHILTTSGQLGINTTSPNSIVHVKGTTPTNCELFLEPSVFNAPGCYSSLKFGDGNHYMLAEFGNGLTIYDGDKIKLFGGNVGVNTSSPTERLDVNGNIKARLLKQQGYSKTFLNDTAVINVNAISSYIKIVDFNFNTNSVDATYIDYYYLAPNILLRPNLIGKFSLTYTAMFSLANPAKSGDIFFADINTSSTSSTYGSTLSVGQTAGSLSATLPSIELTTTQNLFRSIRFYSATTVANTISSTISNCVLTLDGVKMSQFGFY